MEEIAAGLCGLGFLLAFIAVVGHLLWLAFAAVLRALGGTLPRPAGSGRSCHICDTAIPPDAIRCPGCGNAALVPPLVESVDNLTFSGRILDWLKARERLTSETHANMRTILRESSRAADRAADQARWERAGDERSPSRESPFSRDAATATATDSPEAQHDIVDAVLVTGSEDQGGLGGSKTALSPQEPADAEGIAEPAGPVEGIVFRPAREDRGAVAAASSASPAAAASHALDRDYDPREATAAHAAVRQRFGELLTSFMAERNIRWGELISGMLIVGSAVGLVISLRATLSDRIPYFPALIFMLITLAIHASGIYTLRRWNLRSTSRGVLMIAMLLVPLNFLAAILMSGGDQRAVTDPIYLLAVSVGVLASTWMTYSAGRALLGRGWWRLTAAVLTSAVGQLVIARRVVASPELLQVNLLTSVPLFGFLLAALTQLRAGIHWSRLTPERGRRILSVLGIAGFSFAIPLGLLIAELELSDRVLARLSPTLSLAAAALLATGLFLSRRAKTPKMSGLATTGTAVAVLGGMAMVIAVVLAWPEPRLLIVVGLANLLILTMVAVVGDLPLLHVPAVACATLAAVVGFVYWQGLIASLEPTGIELFRALLIGRVGLVLSLMAVLSGVAGVVWALCRKRLEAYSYFAAGGAAALLALAVAGYSGFVSGKDAWLTAPVFGAYGLLALVIAVSRCFEPRWLRRIPRSEVQQATGTTLGMTPRLWTQAFTWVGSVLVFLAMLHACWRNPAVQTWLQGWDLSLQHRILTALVGHALLMLLVAGGIAWRFVGLPLQPGGKTRWYAVLEPLLWSAGTTILTGLLGAVWVREGAFGLNAGYLVAIALGFLGIAVLYRSGGCYSVFQAVSALAVAYGIAEVCQMRGWGQAWFRDPRHLHAQWIGLSLWCATGPLLRRALRRWPASRTMLSPPWPPVDQILQSILVVGFLVLVAVACWPGLQAECGIASAANAMGAEILAGRLAWLSLAAIGISVLCYGWEGIDASSLGGVAVLPAAAAGLISVPFSDVTATASVLRWLMALYVVLTATAIWLRGPLTRWLGRVPWLRLTPVSPADARFLRATVLAIGMLPVVILTTVVAWRGVAGLPTGEPAAATIFARMGNTASYGIPLLALVAVLVGYAVRERKPAYALAGSCLFQYFVTLAYLLQAASDQAGYAAGLLQWNACAAGAYGLLWMVLLRWMRPVDGDAEVGARLADAGDGWLPALQSRIGLPLTVQFCGAYVLLGGICVWAAMAVLVRPGGVSAYTRPLGDPASYVAWLLIIAGFAWCWWQTTRGARGRKGLAGDPAEDAEAGAATVRAFGVSGWDPSRGQVDTLLRAATHFAAGLIPLLAVSVARTDAFGDWRGYHTLTFGWLVLATGLTLGAGFWRGLWREAAGLCILTTVLAWRGVSDPHAWAPWWSVTAAAWTGLLTGLLAWFRRQSLFAYASVGLAVSASTLYWIGAGAGRWSRDPAQNMANLLVSDLTVLFLAAFFWQSFEIYLQRRRDERGLTSADGPTVHVAVSLLGGIVAALLLGGTCFLNAVSARGFVELVHPGGIGMLLCLGLLVFASLWDRRRPLGLAAPYTWGALVVVFLLDALHLSPHELFFASTVAAAGYAAVMGLVWQQGVRIAAAARAAGVDDPVGLMSRAAGWMPLIHALIAIVTLGTSLAVVLVYPERGMRISCGLVPAALAVGLGAMAQKERRAVLQYVALFSAGLSAIYLGWADIGPDWSDAAWLSRLTRLLIVLCALTFLYTAVVTRWVRPASNWWLPLRRVTVTFAGSALAALALVLVVELAAFEPGSGTPMDTAQMVAVAVVLVLLAGGLIAMAVQPGRDPLSLSESGRMGYVYAAEVVATLLFVHIFLCRPQWFAGFLRPYWPYIMLTIAFAGVGVGEICKRSGQRVLSEPLQRTGAFLPLLPAIGFWVLAADGTSYTVLLFFAGVLYVLVSMLRNSPLSGFAAALAGNGALWSLLHNTGFSIWQHPQFWLIPPAASALIAGQLNRRRLTSEQLTTLRYVCVLAIYLSSASEVFVRGIGESLWPPMILALLSVAGVFLGIVLRIRAFLFLGSGFVLLSIISMVWHASIAIDHTWPWWAFGIGLGICILIFFGFFEKQRSEIQRWVDSLQRWEK